MIGEEDVPVKASYNVNTKLGKLTCNKIVGTVKNRKLTDESAWPIHISVDNIQLSMEPDNELHMFKLQVNKSPYLDLPYNPKFDASEIAEDEDEEEDVDSQAAAA